MVSVVCDTNVLDIHADSDSKIARKCPWCRRPDEEIIVGERVVVSIDDLQSQRHGRILHVAVAAEVHLEIRERGRGAPRVGKHLECLVHETPVPELLEAPPDRLHELDVHRLVVVLEVHPAADPARDVVERGRRVVDEIPGGFIEAGYSELLDLTGSRDTEKLLDLHLDGQAVCIPAESAFDAMPPHGPVARDDVFDDALKDVSVVRGSCRERGPVVERVLRIRWAHLDRRTERIDTVPEREDALIEFGQIDTRGYPGECGCWFLIGHGSSGALGFAGTRWPAVPPGLPIQGSTARSLRHGGAIRRVLRPAMPVLFPPLEGDVHRHVAPTFHRRRIAAPT